MVDTTDSNIDTIGRLNDRCRQGLDRTAKVMMTSACLATFTEDGTSALAVKWALSTHFGAAHSIPVTANEIAASSSLADRPSSSRSIIMTLPENTAQKTPPIPPRRAES